MRLTDEQLKEIMEKYHVDTLWSYSRLDTFRISPYLFFLKYVKKEPSKKTDVSPYGIIGGACHAVLEKFYHQEISYEDMAKEFENEYVTQIELFGLKFNNTDDQLNSSIEKKYKKDLEHFFRNYRPLNDTKHQMEQHLITKIQDGLCCHGYADDIYKGADGYWINDFKTSSRSSFMGEKLKDKCAQLVLYAKALEQMGVKREQIHASFCMMKYVEVDVEHKNGKVKPMIIERCQIGEKLQPKAAMWLKDGGISEDDVNEMLAQMLADNSIDCLPKMVREKFKIKDYYIIIEDPLSMYEDLKKEIIDIVSEIDNRIHEWEKDFDDKVWFDTDEQLEKQSFYMAQLMDYRPDQHIPYWEWMKRKEEEAQAANDLLGVSQKPEVNDDDDMSWINDLI